MKRTPYSHEVERKVMEDKDRPCLFGVRSPCHHPKCLHAHYETIREAMMKEMERYE